MMIEMIHKDDLDRIDDTTLREYVDYSLRRLPEGFDYFNHVFEYGCFCVVTDTTDLISGEFTVCSWKVPSIKTEVFWDRVELIELYKGGEGNDVVEILVAVDTDIRIGLILRMGILEYDWRKRVMEFYENNRYRIP